MSFIAFFALTSAAVTLAPEPARAAFVPFSCITFNDPADCATGEAQLELEVTDPGGGQVALTFRNLDLGPSEISTLARIYFDDGSLSLFVAIVNDPGTAFIFEPFPGPSDLPGGNLAVPPFMTTIGFLSGAEEPPASSGAEPGEEVTLIFDLLAGQTVADVLAEFESGELRAGVHMINFTGGGSESFVTPEPAAWSLLLLAAAGAALRRRSAR